MTFLNFVCEQCVWVKEELLEVYSFLAQCGS